MAPPKRLGDEADDTSPGDLLEAQDELEGLEDEPVAENEHEAALKTALVSQ